MAGEMMSATVVAAAALGPEATTQQAQAATVVSTAAAAVSALTAGSGWLELSDEGDALVTSVSGRFSSLRWGWRRTPRPPWRSLNRGQVPTNSPKMCGPSKETLSLTGKAQTAHGAMEGISPKVYGALNAGMWTIWDQQRRIFLLVMIGRICPRLLALSRGSTVMGFLFLLVKARGMFPTENCGDGGAGEVLSYATR